MQNDPKWGKVVAVVLSCLCALSNRPAIADDDILATLPKILVAVLGCEEGNYTQCKFQAGCRRINGVWEELGTCEEKDASRVFTEFLDGYWETATSFDNGDFFNYFEFDDWQVKPIGDTPDYYIEGLSYSSPALNDVSPNQVVGSYDSTNQDWFILDYWGIDLGTISALELTFVSRYEFTGCEYYLNYPDLTYQDGICNPVRMTRFKVPYMATTRENSISAAQAETKPGAYRKALVAPGSPFRTNAIRIQNDFDMAGDTHD